MKSKNMNMTEGRPIKLLLLFALPLMLGNMFQNFYVLTDTFIVGRGVGVEALAALGAVDWLSWLLFSIASGFTQGFSILVSQKFGEGDHEGVRRVTGVSLRLSIILTVVCTAGALSLVPTFMKLLNVQESIRPMASMYVSILFGGFALSAFYNFAASMLRAVGDSRTPLTAMIISSVVNIVLDALVVFVFKWGIAGAAGATILSQGVAGVFCFIKMLQTPELQIHKSDLKPDLAMEKTLMGLGMPMSVMNLIISVGGIVVQSVVNTCSIGFIAGFTATNKLYCLLDTAAVSYGFAITTYAGQNYGAEKHKRIRDGINAALLLCVITAVIISSLLFFFSRYLVMAFISSDDPQLVTEAVSTGVRFIRIMAVFLITLYFLYVYRSALQGIGKTVPTMLSGIVEFVIRVTLAIVISRSGNEGNILFCEPAAWIGAMLFLGGSWYYYQVKMLKNDR